MSYMNTQAFLYEEMKYIDFHDLRGQFDAANKVSMDSCNYIVRVACFLKGKEELTYRYDYTSDEGVLSLLHEDSLDSLIKKHIDTIISNEKIMEIRLYKEDKYKDLCITFSDGSSFRYYGYQFKSFYSNYLKKYRPFSSTQKIEVVTSNHERCLLKRK